MKSKITLRTLLLLASIILLAACGGGSQTEASEAPAAEAPVATEAPAEESAKPEPPSQEMGPQLPEDPEDLTCQIDGYKEMSPGDVVGMATEDGDIAEVQIIGDDLVFTSLATDTTQSFAIEYGDQSTVNFAYLIIPIELGNNQTLYAEFLLVTCGNHVYIPIK